MTATADVPAQRGHASTAASARSRAAMAHPVRPVARAVTGQLLSSRLGRLVPSTRMGQRAAELVLRQYGITWRSNGGCTDRDLPYCTSFEGVRWGSLAGLITFRKRSGCRIVVSGGTERGHAQGRHSHGAGYKLDVLPNRCVDRQVARYRDMGVRGDGAALYRSPGRAVFAREPDHWDITFPD